MKVFDCIYDAASMLNNSDAVAFLDLYAAKKQAGETLPVPTDSVADFIGKLIVCLNMTIERITSEYIPLKKCESVCSDEYSKIAFSSLSARVFEVLRVEDAVSFESLVVKQNPDAICVPLKYRNYKVTYKYIPTLASSIDDTIELPLAVTNRLACFGVVSDFLLSRNVFDEAKEWNDRFVAGIKMVAKLSRERRFL